VYAREGRRDSSLGRERAARDLGLVDHPVAVASDALMREHRGQHASLPLVHVAVAGEEPIAEGA
jgi:hypothetical protein